MRKEIGSEGEDKSSFLSAKKKTLSSSERSKIKEKVLKETCDYYEEKRSSLIEKAIDLTIEETARQIFDELENIPCVHENCLEHCDKEYRKLKKK